MTQLFALLAECEVHIERAFEQQNVSLLKRLHAQHNSILSQIAEMV